MIDKVLFIQNGLNIIFPRRPSIRREANDIEDILRGKYSQPQVVPVPDEMDAQIPRLIFGSIHGFSQIVITQEIAALNVKYSPDWQEDIEKGKNYLKERIGELQSITKNYNPSYCGVTTVVRMPVSGGDREVLELLNKGYGRFNKLDGFHDFQLKYTTFSENKYFSNMTIKNFRIWKQEISGSIRLSRDSAIAGGIEIVNDFNNRFGFNESVDFKFDINEMDTIIEKGIEATLKEIQNIREITS